MEDDGVTRIFDAFGTGSDRPTVYELYPVKRLTRSRLHKDFQLLIGEEAQVVIDRQDAGVKKLSSISEARNERGVLVRQMSHDGLEITLTEGEVVSLPEARHPRDAEDFAFIARSVEQHLGKTGLTIVIHPNYKD